MHAVSLLRYPEYKNRPRGRPAPYIYITQRRASAAKLKNMARARDIKCIHSNFVLPVPFRIKGRRLLKKDDAVASGNVPGSVGFPS